MYTVGITATPTSFKSKCSLVISLHNNNYINRERFLLAFQSWENFSLSKVMEILLRIAVIFYRWHNPSDTEMPGVLKSIGNTRSTL